MRPRGVWVRRRSKRRVYAMVRRNRIGRLQIESPDPAVNGTVGDSDKIASVLARKAYDWIADEAGDAR